MQKSQVSEGIVVRDDGWIERTFRSPTWRSSKLSVTRGVKDAKGYRKIMVDGRWQYVHRLVALAFIPNLGQKPCVNHLDGDKGNNLASNLEWVTYSENHAHAYRVLGRARPLGRDLGGGVCFDRSRQKWMAYKAFDGRRRYLGRYETEQGARESVDQAMAEARS